MGGAEAALTRARQDFEKGEFRWVAEIVNAVVFSDPNNKDARMLGADARQFNKGWFDVHVYIANNNVYAERLDEWEVTTATHHGQKIETRLFGDVFDILRDMDEDGDILLPKGFSHCISIKPNVMNGEPVIKNTRVPIASIAAKFHQGVSLDRLAELYTPISRLCIEKAVEYEDYLNSPIPKTGEAVSGR